MHPLLEPGRYIGVDEFASFVGDREEAGDINHYELLNGRVVVTPPAGWPHGEIDSRLGMRVASFVEDRGLGKVFGSSQGFAFPLGDVVEPDLSFVSNERWRAAPPPEEGRFLHVVPDLLVEILSKETRQRDVGEKKGIYERAGVREYWIADSKRARITRLVLRRERFDLGARFDAGSTLESEILAGLRIEIDRVFAR